MRNSREVERRRERDKKGKREIEREREIQRVGKEVTKKAGERNN